MISLWARLKRKSLSKKKLCKTYSQNKSLKQQMAVHSLLPNPWSFLQEAQAVLDAGRELWRYYHKQAGANPNASYYDIKMHFQGTKTTKSGKVQMNSTSEDATYNSLLANLRQAMKGLAAHIEPKVYEYGFLKK